MPEFKIFKQQEILDNLNLLKTFYCKYYGDTYDIAIKNSSHVCCAIKNKEVVGACRLVTDYCSHTFIVDLFVKEEERKNGVGTQLMKDAIQCLLELNTFFNSISTDPSRPWLKNFYEKLGFTSIENHNVLIYPKDKK
jgi:predicted GNAT family N-acyltransferase